MQLEYKARIQSSLAEGARRSAARGDEFHVVFVSDRQSRDSPKAAKRSENEWVQKEITSFV
ncbi:MAG: hypothetical protein DHS20C12_16540 [Pseudohongiella sp.]|nr:MAG: hypothetical protein DHS20C12_16540 [Pseudohongiella sp.]